MKPKDELGKNGIELLKIYSPLTYNALRQQTAEEILKSCRKRLYQDEYHNFVIDIDDIEIIVSKYLKGDSKSTQK